MTLDKIVKCWPQIYIYRSLSHSNLSSIYKSEFRVLYRNNFCFTLVLYFSFIESTGSEKETSNTTILVNYTSLHPVQVIPHFFSCSRFYIAIVVAGKSRSKKVYTPPPNRSAPLWKHTKNYLTMLAETIQSISNMRKWHQAHEHKRCEIHTIFTIARSWFGGGLMSCSMSNWCWSKCIFLFLYQMEMNA